MFWKKKPTNSPSATTFDYFAPDASSVFLCGDFNSWKTDATPLNRDATGRWKVSMNLNPGRYEYRFLVDGEWQNDQRPVFLVDNSVGSQNCLIEITG